MNEIFLIAGMALVTFLTRYSVLTVSDRLKFPNRLVRALHYVPPAILTAIIVPAVLIPTGSTVVFSYTNARLIGAVIAFSVGWFSQNLLLTIVLGMLSFLGWQWVLATLLA